jgi:hypothetical protein
MSIAPGRFDLVDDPDDLTSKFSIPAGTRYTFRGQLLDLTTPGGVLDPFDPNTFDPISLAAYQGASKGARAYLRLARQAPGAPLATATVALVAGTSGEFDFTLSVASTTALQDIRNGWYDAEVYDESNPSAPIVERIMEGAWKCSAEATRPDV